VLAFVHPVAGKQFVKGTIKSGENPLDAARRELREESGLNAPSALISLGIQVIGGNRQRWYFFEWISTGIPDAWSHQTEDNHGHTFLFFWHPLDLQLDNEWHPIFHEAFAFFAPLVSTD
jgi:8-oxo-dGTP pyrophosphatase MutT (NUDIX family)